MVRKFFFCVQCPKHEECNLSRSRKKLWGWTEDECRRSVVHHLTASSHHYASKEDAELLAGWAEIKEGEMDEEEVAVVTDNRVPRPPEGPPPVKKARVGKGGAGSSLDVSTVQDIVSAAVQAVQVQVQQPQPPVTTLADSGDTVTLRSTQVKALVDSLSRACHSLRQAERVTEGAMRAFRDEAFALEQVKDEIRNMTS